jgi:hypothetical protein
MRRPDLRKAESYLFFCHKNRFSGVSTVERAHFFNANNPFSGKAGFRLEKSFPFLLKTVL